MTRQTMTGWAADSVMLTWPGNRSSGWAASQRSKLASSTGTVAPSPRGDSPGALVGRRRDRRHGLGRIVEVAGERQPVAGDLQPGSTI